MAKVNGFHVAHHLNFASMEFLRGRVVKSTGSWYELALADGERLQARIRGALRLQGIKSTNPVAVGDWVKLEREANLETGIISEVEQRRNYMIRKSNKLSKQTQVIAANLDMAALVISLVEPAVSMGFIDRFLVTAEAYHIPAMIILNKADLLGFQEARAIVDEWKQLYTELGYHWCEVSASKQMGVSELAKQLAGRTTLFSGHSGVGKTTLLNALVPGLNRKTGVISSWGKGKHTTTFAEMFTLPGGGDIIDTPGIREFGVVDIPDEEIGHYFPEMRALLPHCHFSNCRHVEEPKCAVKAALSDGKIHEGRYHSYLSMLAHEDIF